MGRLGGFATAFLSHSAGQERPLYERPFLLLAAPAAAAPAAAAVVAAAAAAAIP